MPVAVGRGGLAQFGEDVRVRLEGEDGAGKARILARHGRILAAIGADVEQAVDGEGGQEALERLDFGILVDAAGQRQAQGQRAVGQFADITAHARSTWR